MSKKDLDVIIIIPPPWATHLPPLGAAYLSANLRNKGLKTLVYDLNLELFEKATDVQRSYWDLNSINCSNPEELGFCLYNNFFADFKQGLSVISSTNVLGFSINSHISCAFSAKLARHIKKVYPEKIIIFGGPGCYHGWDRRFADKSVDFFVIGDGEKTLWRLINAISDKNGDVNIPGVINNNTQEICKFIPPEPVELNSLVFPDFSEFNLLRYQRNLSIDNQSRALPLLMSKGCVNKCSFCIDHYMQGSYRFRYPEKIVEELVYHINKNQTHRFEFNDLLCNGNLQQLRDVCDLIIEKGLKIEWSSYAAIRRDMSKELLIKMKKSGCVSLCYGLESASDKVLSLMNKRYGANDAKNVLMSTKEAGISTHINIIIGFPQETEDDFAQTREFLIENRQYIDTVANLSTFVLMPVSNIGICPQHYGIRNINNGLNWSDSNGLTAEKRGVRLKEMVNLAKELNIASNIVNTKLADDSDQDSPIKLLNTGELKVLSPEIMPCEIGRSNLVIEKIRASKLYRLLIILFLLIATLIMDAYLYLLKRVRGTIIFPGG